MRDPTQFAWFLLALSCVCKGDNEAMAYYCPQSNAFLIEHREEAATKRKASSVQRSDWEFNVVDGDSLQALGSTRRLLIVECGKRGFDCVHVAPQDAGATSAEFRLALPRVISHRKETVFDGIRMLSRRAYTIAAPNSPRMGTVTIRQLIAGKESAIDLTVEAGRGVVFIDGIRISDDNATGETCVLESKRGLFASVKIR
jgi:hypothetical protein